MKFQFNPYSRASTLFFLSMLFWGSAYSQSKQDTLHIVVVGNSFSRNATEYLPELAKEGGHPLVIQKAEISGGSLQDHWEAVESSRKNPQADKGRPYKGKSLGDILSERQWDMITFQQASTISADIGSYFPYIDSLYNYVISYQPDIKIMIHQTWPYRIDAPYFSRYRNDKRVGSAEEMWKKTHAIYRVIQSRYDAGIIPTGDGFWALGSDPDWGYKVDRTYDLKHPNYPELPDQQYSLHVGYSWNKNKKFKFDSHHASVAGCYLGSLIWYSVLFKESPVKLRFRPVEISEKFARKLKVTAVRVTPIEIQENQHLKTPY